MSSEINAPNFQQNSNASSSDEIENRDGLNCINASLASNQSDRALNTSRVGGPLASLPPQRAYPKDKQGKAMLFLAQINFADFSGIYFEMKIPQSGILSLFINEKCDLSNPKDRHAFSFMWNAAGASSDKMDSDTESQKRSSAQPLCEPDLPTVNQLLPTPHFLDFSVNPADNSEELRQIAAFAGNGVSWSKARSTDSCFSHLVDASKDWILLLRIASLKECGLSISADTLNILIRREDLTNGNLEKAWLLPA